MDWISLLSQLLGVLGSMVALVALWIRHRENVSKRQALLAAKTEEEREQIDSIPPINPLLLLLVMSCSAFSIWSGFGVRESVLAAKGEITMKCNPPCVNGAKCNTKNGRCEADAKKKVAGVGGLIGRCWQPIDDGSDEQPCL